MIRASWNAFGICWKLLSQRMFSLEGKICFQNRELQILHPEDRCSSTDEVFSHAATRKTWSHDVFVSKQSKSADFQKNKFHVMEKRDHLKTIGSNTSVQWSAHDEKVAYVQETYVSVYVISKRIWHKRKVKSLNLKDLSIYWTGH